MKRFIVFDGNSLINRAYYGIRPLTTKDGLFTHATYGFFNIINKHLSSGEKYDYAAVAFDLPDPTFRHKAYDGYKATRKGMPEELAVQLPYAKRLLPAMGIKTIELSGFEADDLLGTIAEECSKNNILCDIVTGDRDSFQLISPTSKVLLATNNDTKVYGVEEIKEQYGISPLQLIDMKGLMGDSSDNIPGVAGVGEKTAIKLIAEYGSIENIYENIDAIKGAAATRLKDGKDMAYLSRDLSRIRRDAPIDKDIETYKLFEYDKKELLKLFTELEFSKLIERFELNTSDDENIKAEDVIQVDNKTLLEIAKDKEVSLTITDNLIEVYIDKKVYSTFLTEELSPLFESDDYSLIVWSFKDNAHLIKDKLNFDFKNCIDDVSLMGYILNPVDSGYDLSRLAISFGYDSGENQTKLLYDLRKELKKHLAETEQVDLYEFERKLSIVLFDMENTGFLMDRKGLENYSAELDNEIAKIKERIYMFSGTEFNLNSPKQLGEVLFEDLGLPHGRKTKTGYSTNAEVLEGLRKYSPIIDDILLYRQLAKLKSTYTDGLLNVISTENDRIHTTFRQTLTLTGRLSSAEPNLQNIPVRQEAGRVLRKFFVADEGNVLIDADYSQIELRVLAHISGDDALINAFKNGDDIHTITASQVFGVSPQDVDSHMRDSAKAVNFGIIYGISDYSLSVDIGVTKKAAGEYIDGYFSKYPKVREYMDNTIENAKRDGYVETLMGRRRYIPELSSPKKQVVKFGQRVAMNTPIQGSAADIIKKAMIDVYDALKKGDYRSKLILQVHDELIIESPESEVDEVLKLMTKCMENAVDLAVPMKVDAKVGKRWYDTKE